MTHNNPNTTEQNVTSTTWWTPRRTKLAGICGLLGGIGGLALARLPIISTGLGIAPRAIGLLYPVWYVLFVVALLAVHARYSTSYGRGGRYVAALFGLSLVSYAGSTIILSVGVFDSLLTPIGFLAGMAYLAMRVLGCLYGISLWRHTNTSRLTAGLFIISFPAIFVFGALNELGFPDVLIIGATLYLAFIALGYDLWRTAGDTTARGHEAMG
jgi:hypothetical protein